MAAERERPSAPPVTPSAPKEAFWARGEGPRPDPGLLVDAARDFAIFSVDPYGILTSWSDGAERLTGHTAAEVLGQDFALMWTPEDVAARRPYLELEECATQGRVEIDNWVRRRDGTRFWASGACRPLRDADDAVVGFVKVLRDTSKRREAAVRQQQEHERLKLFQSLVVHELRNPLGPMLIQLRLLGRAPTDAKQRHALDILERNLRRVQRLCDDLADAAHLQLGTFPIEPRSTDLGRIVHDTVDTLAGHAREAGVVLRAQVAGPLPLQADPHRLSQVLHNLTVNAIRATPEGGEVVVAAMPGQGGRLRAEVRDTGLGMTAQTIAQLFQPFTRVAPGASAGMGLGLYLSKAILRGHEGDLWAQSKGLGEGSTFVLELPAVPPVPAMGADPLVGAAPVPMWSSPVSPRASPSAASQAGRPSQMADAMGGAASGEAAAGAGSAPGVAPATPNGRGRAEARTHELRRSERPPPRSGSP